MREDYIDYYGLLDLEEDASLDEIKKAFRKKALKYHPDVSDSPTAHEEFIKYGEAYEVLSNEEKRRSYDRLRASRSRSGFDEASERDFRDHRARAEEKARDYSYNYDLEDILSSVLGLVISTGKIFLVGQDQVDLGFFTKLRLGLYGNLLGLLGLLTLTGLAAPITIPLIVLILGGLEAKDAQGQTVYIGLTRFIAYSFFTFLGLLVCLFLLLYRFF